MEPMEPGERVGLLARVAHDLIQPLNAIGAAAQVVRVSADRAAVDRAARVIERQASYLREFVDRILDEARNRHWHPARHFVPVDICEIARQVIEANRVLCTQGGLQLVEDIPAGPVLVDGDPVALQEIVWNLLANAVHYTPAGGSIRVRVLADDDQVVVAIRDTGIGLEPSEINRLFRGVTESERSGPERRGLGLAIASTLAQVHGGGIDVRSDGHGCGTEFRLRLPVR
jgi:signal transduction histidine kinase